MFPLLVAPPQKKERKRKRNEGRGTKRGRRTKLTKTCFKNIIHKELGKIFHTESEISEQRDREDAALFTCGEADRS